MASAVHVKVLAINNDYGYSLVEVENLDGDPCSFVVSYNHKFGRYEFKQTGENNEWNCFPDERK